MHAVRFARRAAVRFARDAAVRFARGSAALACAALACAALAPAAFARTVSPPPPPPAAAPPASTPPPVLAHAPLVFAGLDVAAAESAAIAASPEVAGARARLAQSRYALAAARAGIAPALTSTYAQVPQGNPPGPAIVSRQLTAGIVLNVADFIAYSPAMREAAFNLAAAQADAGAAEAAERVKVVGLYFDALKARAVASARRDALALATSQSDAASIRVRAGDAPRLDVLRSDVAVARATADLETAAVADQNAAEALRVETNAAPDALAATTPGQFAPIDAKLTDPQAAVARAVALRPEIRSAQRSADAANAAIRSARAAGFPTATLTGGYLAGTDSGVPIHAPTLNAALTIPLSSANRERVSLAAAKAVEAQTKAASVERQIRLDVGSAARSLGAAQRGAAATSRARQSAEAELRATELGYRSGASSSLELTSARSTYSQAVVDELSSLYDVEKARATLAIEVGS